MRLKELNEILAALQRLVGKEIHAFGKDSKGCWGKSDTVKTFKIKDFGFEIDLLNVYLEDYDCQGDGDKMIYTDPRFEKELRELFKQEGIKASLGYSEAGMQGDDFVNFDCIFK